MIERTNKNIDAIVKIELNKITIQAQKDTITTKTDYWKNANVEYKTKTYTIIPYKESVKNVIY